MWKISLIIFPNIMAKSGAEWFRSTSKSRLPGNKRYHLPKASFSPTHIVEKTMTRSIPLMYNLRSYIPASQLLGNQVVLTRWTRTDAMKSQGSTKEMTVIYFWLSMGMVLMVGMLVNLLRQDSLSIWIWNLCLSLIIFNTSKIKQWSSRIAI